MSSKIEEGVIIADKPENITSASFLGRIKRLLKIKKAGHAGTLDPFATGILICCFGKATKLCRFLISGKKKYEAEIYLGVKTDTCDITGKIVEENKVTNISKAEIKKVTDKFTGYIEQTPPAYSALKYNGIPLYKLARNGKFIVKEKRKIYIEYIKITDINIPYIKIEVSCSAGTYIRTLASDIGEALGTKGCLSQLRRTYCSGFDISEAVSFEQLEKNNPQKYIITPNGALKDIPQFRADLKLCEKISYGKKITVEDIPLYDNSDIMDINILKIVNRQNRLIAILGLTDKKNYKYYYVFN